MYGKITGKDQLRYRVRQVYKRDERNKTVQDSQIANNPVVVHFRPIKHSLVGLH